MQPVKNHRSSPDSARRGQLDAILIMAFASGWLTANCLSPLPAAAQVAAPQTQTKAPSAEALRQREQELEAARSEAKNAAEAQQKLKAEIAALGQDRSKLNEQLIDVAAQVRAVQTRIA